MLRARLVVAHTNSTYDTIEVAMIKIRWAWVGASLLLIPLAPGVAWHYSVALALWWATGNIVVSRLLRLDVFRARWRLTQFVALMTDWLGAGALLVLVRASIVLAAAILAYTVAVTSLRGRACAVVTAPCAMISLWLYTAYRTWLISSTASQELLRTVIGASLLIGMTGLTFGILCNYCGNICRKSGIERSPITFYSPYSLSPREYQVLQLLARQDLTYEQIGSRLDPPVSRETVKTHARRIADKLGVARRRDAIIEAAIQRGLVLMEEEGIPHE